MSNEELKEKIVSIVRGAMIEADELPFIETTDNITDALIAAGIGDVSELQKECDSKEEAYNKCYFDFKHWKDKAKEYKHRAKIAESENAELRARLEKAVELPCKVGDTVYQHDQNGNIYESKIKNIIYDTNGIAFFDKSAIGGSIFLTREAVEARLAELKGEKK